MTVIERININGVTSLTLTEGAVLWFLTVFELLHLIVMKAKFQNLKYYRKTYPNL